MANQSNTSSRISTAYRTAPTSQAFSSFPLSSSSSTPSDSLSATTLDPGQHGPSPGQGRHGDNTNVSENTPNTQIPRRPVGVAFTEDMSWKRTLGTWDVAALIFNKQVGAGFFTTSGQVLTLAGSKRLSIALWIVGGIYSMISFTLYLEYGLNYRYNGGDLIYLDRIFSEAVPSPVLLAVTIYSVYFICFATTTGNTFAFAKTCLAAADPAVENTSQFDRRLVNLLAISILTVVCLLLYFSRETSRGLNRWLMVYKSGLLFTIFVAGAVVRGSGKSPDDWSSAPNVSVSGFSRLSAMIYIVYSYQGWENANYVTGEIKLSGQGSALKWGGYIACFLTMLLYVLATIGYYWVVSFADIVSSNSDLGMGQDFAAGAFNGNKTGFRVCIAISAIGNLIAVIYTNATVKQTIALQQFIPFYKFFASDRPFGTPGGAIFLQWLTTIPFILAIPNTPDAYGFVIGIWSYVHLVILIPIGLGILVFSARQVKRQGSVAYSQNTDTQEKWHFQFLTNSFLRVVLVFLFVGTNLLVLVSSAMPPNAKGKIPRWIWPVLAAGSIVLGVIYWFVLWALQSGDRTKLPRFLSRWTGVHAKVNDIHAMDRRTAGHVTSSTAEPHHDHNSVTTGTSTHSPNKEILQRHVTDSVENGQRTTEDGINEYESMMRAARLDGTRYRVNWTVGPGLVKNIFQILKTAKDIFISHIW